MPCFDAVPEDGPEPKRQRLLALFEDRPGDYRNLATTANALVNHPLRRQEVRPAAAAVGAAKALRPLQPREVLTALAFVDESSSELRLSAWKFK
jgi:hypothetical protein